MGDSACDTAALYDNKLHTWTDGLGDLISLTELAVSYCELLKSQQTGECIDNILQEENFYWNLNFTISLILNSAFKTDLEISQ